MHDASKVPQGAEPSRAFPATRWSMVQAAGQATPESAAALAALCEAYWQPLYVYARRCGQSPHDAEDLTQEFFRCLLEKRWLDDARRERGRLRTFLIVAMKRFMRKEWRRAAAQRRGGGELHVPIDTAFAESRLAADTQSLAPDAAFDREWALTVLDLTAKRLRAEFSAAGKPDVFDELKSCLLAERGGIDYARIGARLDLSAGAVRVAVHRLRKRFREIFREEMLQTLADGADVEAELRHLAAALGTR